MHQPSSRERATIVFPPDSLYALKRTFETQTFMAGARLLELAGVPEALDSLARRLKSTFPDIRNPRLESNIKYEVIKGKITTTYSLWGIADGVTTGLGWNYPAVDERDGNHEGLDVIGVPSTGNVIVHSGKGFEVFFPEIWRPQGGRDQICAAIEEAATRPNRYSLPE